MGEGIATYQPQQLKGIHDPSVMFEEYLYYAEQTRREEENIPRVHKLDFIKSKVGKKTDVVADDPTKGPTTKETDVQGGPPGYSHGVSDEEWAVASRAARTATWGAVFYLITTDILGPYRGSPPNDHLHPTHTPSKIQPPHSKMDNISYNDRIKLTITNLKS
jgi:hypothetical protein